MSPFHACVVRLPLELAIPTQLAAPPASRRLCPGHIFRHLSTCLDNARSRARKKTKLDVTSRSRKHVQPTPGVVPAGIVFFSRGRRSLLRGHYRAPAERCSAARAERCSARVAARATLEVLFVRFHVCFDAVVSNVQRPSSWHLLGCTEVQ